MNLDPISPFEAAVAFLAVAVVVAVLAHALSPYLF